MSNEQRHAKAAPDLYLKRVEPGDYCYFEITEPRNPKEERIIAIKDKHFETAMNDDKGWLVKDLRVEGGSNDENSEAIKRLIEEKKFIKIKKKHYIHPDAGGTHPIVLAGLDKDKDFCPNSKSDRTRKKQARKFCPKITQPWPPGKSGQKSSLPKNHLNSGMQSFLVANKHKISLD